MKLKIEKLSNGNVEVVLQTDASKKPLRAELPPDQVRALIRVLSLALDASAFRFMLDL